MLNWVFIFLGSLPILYIYLTWNNNYWKKKGVPQVRPWPLVGNLLDFVLMKKSIAYIHKELYEKFPEAPVIGFYHSSTPALIVKCPELVKTVLVKEFSSFYDNYTHVNEKDEPYAYRDAFYAKGPHWKIHRAAVVPVFNSGRIKSIFPQMLEISKQLEDYMDSTLDTEIEPKHLAFLFTTDVVSNCAFGISGNSFTGTEALFKEMGRLMVDHFNNPYKKLATVLFPKLNQLFRIREFPESVGNFLKSAIMQSRDYRKKNNIERNDFLQYAFDLQGKKHTKDSDAEYTITDIVGYAMTFFVEGFETSAMTAGFALYELACNADVQEKLRTEILSVVTKRDDLDFEKLHSIAYLEKVVLETLRKYPISFSLMKVCTKDIILNVEGKSLSVKKDTPVVIPVYSIQNDPKYFPNPEKFDPERFSKENVSCRPHYTFLAFGEGPRMCLGMRFAMTQVKLFLAIILLKYTILPTKNTPEVMRFNKLLQLTTSEDQILVKFKRNT